MNLSSRQAGAVRVLGLAGRLDHAHAEAFRIALAPHLRECMPGGVSLVLDFSGVSYISSVGLRVLMLAAKQVGEQQGRIAVAALSPLVAEVFQVSHFDLVFQVFATVDEAAAALAP